MARSGDPMCSVRWSPAEWALVDGLAEEAGVSTASLVREAALRAGRDVAREVKAGRLTSLRARTGQAKGRAGGSSSVPARSVVPVVGAVDAVVSARAAADARSAAMRARLG